VETYTKQPVEIEITRYNRLPVPLRVCFLAFTCIGVFLSFLWIFNYTSYGEYALLPAAYYYLLIALFISSAYLLLPASKKNKSLPWYDLIAAALSFGLGLYLFFNSWPIMHVGWLPPTWGQFAVGVAFCLLILEAGRRVAGNLYMIVCLIIGFYPVYADRMPGILFGFYTPIRNTIGHHAFSAEGLLGIPAKVLGDIVIAFLIFAGILIATGAGTFFLKLSQALLGGFRGGAAKVAVVASGFFGSLSGSAMSNVAATGSITIPAMKRMGYPPHYAGAIEACASTGGVFMPPVMGAVAFVLCAMLNTEYSLVIIAAAVPSLLYYIGLLLQVDSYAARAGLKGMPKEELPSIKETLKNGWPFLTVFIFLLWGLLVVRWDVKTPYYASLMMIVLSFFRKETKLSARKSVDAIVRVGSLITQTFCVVLPIGFIVAGLSITGTSASFTSGLVGLGGGNLYLVILIGIVVCFILGMGGMLVSAYVFLAVTLAPAIVQLGNLNELAVHLFIVYYCMLSCLTPPVALISFLAASFAGAPPMKTAVLSMRLGFVKYFIPLFFLFNPSLIFQGKLLDGIGHFLLSVLGVAIMAGGLDGYLVWIGRIKGVVRPILVIAGLLTAFPDYRTTMIGLIPALLILAVIRVRPKSGGIINETGT